MKKLRITVNNKAYDVTVEVLEDDATVVNRAMDSSRRVAPEKPSTTVGAVVPGASLGNDGVSSRDTNIPSTSGSVDAGDVIAPISGAVVSVEVKLGDAVEKNQVLILLEAMKMETSIRAPCKGVVSAIDVTPGDAVAEGTLLIRIS